MAASTEILVVDDELDLREMVAEYLARHGFRVRTAMDGEAMAARLQVKSADLVILDIAMPGEDGLTLARRLREHSDVCIMMLTASGETVDRVVGLEMGADDYIAKPFDLRELLARVRTVLRRRADADARSARPDAPPDTLRFGRWLLDLGAHKLLDEDGGEELRLTSMEFDLLHAFARHPNKVLSRNQLLDLAHHRDWEPFDRSIDIRVARLRKKIERDPAKPQILKTIPGAGYMYVSDGR
jgi:two-component system phosphate regulon response regulator OmpR